MKKTLYIGLALAAAFVATAVFARNSENLTELETEALAEASAREVVRLTRFEGQEIRGVSAGGSFRVELVKVNAVAQNKAIVEIDGELERYLKFEIDGNGIVKVGFDFPRNFNNNSNRTLMNAERKLTLYLGELDRVNITGSGRLQSADESTVFTGNNTSIKIAGSGRVTNLRVETGKLTVDCTGSGSVTLKAKSGELYASTAGSGRSDITSTGNEYAKVSVSGSGSITVRGDAVRADMSSSGSGNVRGEEFRVKSVNARAAGSGGVRVWAEESIEGRVAGSGSVRYKGNPTQINVSKSGSGSIRAL